MEIGQLLEMIATDPGVVPDMEAWERQTRHEILLSEEQSKGKFRFLIKKTH
jgi:TusA-related sulfurtransferase